METLFCAGRKGPGLTTSRVPPNDLILQGKVSASVYGIVWQLECFEYPTPTTVGFQEEEGI